MNNMDLLQREVQEPVPHIHIIETTLNGLVPCVKSPVPDQHVLYGMHRLVVLQPVEVHLCVIGDDSLNRVSQD